MITACASGNLNDQHSLYEQDGNCPANISVTKAHSVFHTVWAAKRDVPLLGTWGWAICWPEGQAQEPAEVLGVPEQPAPHSLTQLLDCASMGCVTWEKHNALTNLLRCNGDAWIWWIHALWEYNLVDRCVRQPVAAQHHHVVITDPQQSILSKISRSLCRKSPLSHNKNMAALCMHIQAGSKHQLGEKFRRLFPKELKTVKAKISHNL